MSNEEQERLKKLRDRQLQVRNPLARQRKFQQSSSVKEKRMRKSFSLSRAWKDIPHMIRSPFYGLILGLLVVLVLPMIWDSAYALIAGAGATLLFIIYGLILGNSLDLRDRIRDHLK